VVLKEPVGVVVQPLVGLHGHPPRLKAFPGQL
jgi:hypothetical protein